MHLTFIYPFKALPIFQLKTDSEAFLFLRTPFEVLASIPPSMLKLQAEVIPIFRCCFPKIRYSVPVFFPSYSLRSLRAACKIYVSPPPSSYPQSVGSFWSCTFRLPSIAGHPPSPSFLTFTCLSRVWTLRSFEPPLQGRRPFCPTACAWGGCEPLVREGGRTQAALLELWLLIR